MIESDEWYRIATVGDHRRFKHPRKVGRVTISGHLGDEMPKGTLASVGREAGWKGEKES